MLEKEELTTISLKKGTRNRLKNYGAKGTTWDKLLNDLMDEVDNLNSATTDLSFKQMRGE